MTHRRSASAQGNALFLILIAVALFAALAYAVTQSGRGTGDISREQASLNIARMLQFVSRIESTVSRLRLASGCSDTQISFAYDSDHDGDVDASDYYNNPSAPSDKRCHVFDPAGGGMVYEEAPAGINDGTRWAFTGINQLPKVGNDCVTADCAELIAILPHVTLKACVEINTKFGAPMTGDVPPEEGSNMSINDFTGSYGANVYINGFSTAIVTSGCINGTTVAPLGAVGDDYYFFSLLMGR